MRLPSEADIEAAKKAAASKGTTAELLTYEDINACVIALAFTPATWAAYLDAQQKRTVSDAKDAAYAEQVVWPAPAEADALAERVPAMASNVVNDLSELAGYIDAAPKTCKLTASTSDMDLERAGLTRESAKAIIERAEESALTLARFPSLDVTTPGKGFAVVVKTPSKAIYRARIEVYQRAKDTASGVFDCAAQAARDCIVWTSEGENPDPIFAMYPGVVAGDLISLFVNSGGASAKGERRRL